MDKVLIIAFDGLDYELIQEFGLENVPQEEFGTIDNTSGVNTVVTTELFASFITGETWEEHGALGLGKHKKDWLNSFENSLNRYRFFKKFSGLRRSFYEQVPFFEGGRTSFTREDLRSPALFDKVSNSKAIDVPSYSVGYNVDLMGILDENGLSHAVEELDRFTEWKKRELFDEMEEGHDLIMAHFHKPDHIHHWFWEVGKMDKVEETYREMDEFAGEILEKAEENGFDTVIFMSDHGLPDVENGGHNENAFYSCNHELFGDRTPHITDFHDKVLELTNQEEVEDIDV
ncbi:MAG: alkaline phosphatase family protein [Candidatus Nanohalobium sp.]